MLEIVFNTTPGVFGDERLDQAPRLPPVLHIRVDSNREFEVLFSIVKSKKIIVIKLYFTSVDTFALSDLLYSTGLMCKSNRDKEHHGCRHPSPPGNTDLPWTLCKASENRRENKQEAIIHSLLIQSSAKATLHTNVNTPGFLLQWMTFQPED